MALVRLTVGVKASTNQALVRDWIPPKENSPSRFMRINNSTEAHGDLQTNTSNGQKAVKTCHLLIDVTLSHLVSLSMLRSLTATE